MYWINNFDQIKLVKMDRAVCPESWFSVVAVGVVIRGVVIRSNENQTDEDGSS